MSKKTFILLTALLFAVSVFADNSVQKPVAAGLFYPSDPVLLARDIDKYLEQATPPNIDGKIVALISPHAGYIYSGSVAAYGYKAISRQKYDTIVIIGLSHNLAHDGVSILEKDYYETPFGQVRVDSDFSKELMRLEKNLIYFQPQAYEEEHSAEVQIPFLQRSLENKDFKVVLLLIGRPSYYTCEKLAAALVKVIKKSGKEVLIIASTDLSHYYSYRDAVTKDQVTLSEIMRLDADRLAVKISEKECELCGVAPVLTAILAGKELGADKVKVLKYANSGDVTGNKGSVVGYGSIVIYRALPLIGVGKAYPVDKGEEVMLNTEQKNKLLDIARKTIEANIKDGKKFEAVENDPALMKIQGAFVTLKEGEQLRGCIGSIVGQNPLYLTVRDMAIESAASDPRFEPVTAAELKDIKIEISVLSEPKLVKNTDEIIMGTHGVIVKRGPQSGVFLPQVANETGWSKEEFLSTLCSQKAGLPADAWKDKKTELYTFTAQVFGEE